MDSQQSLAILVGWGWSSVWWVVGVVLNGGLGFVTLYVAVFRGRGVPPPLGVGEFFSFDSIHLSVGFWPSVSKEKKNKKIKMWPLSPTAS
jgi:hypothetical protein